MKIAIFTLGTRGDVQPYAVLGQALQHRGHQVTLCTARNFESLVLSYGLTFYPIEADFQALLDSEEGKKLMKGNPWVIRRNLHTWVYPLITESLATFYQLAQAHDRILYHVKTLADCFADQFPHKMLRASVLPITQPTSDFPNPALSGLPIPRWANRLSYKLGEWSMKMLAKPIRRFRIQAGLSPNYDLPVVRNLYGLSSHWITQPQDYPKQDIFSGFWFESSHGTLSAEIQSFLADGAPPLLITFGSMPFENRMSWTQGIQTLIQTFNLRVIILQGWGISHWREFEENPHVLVVSEAPHALLFPHVKAIIHHGGIGTTAACLRAGKPFWICPILYPIGDQLFWGKQGVLKGVAVPPVPLKKLTLPTFLSRVTELWTNPSLYHNALLLQHHINQENGLEGAIRIVESS